MTIRAWLVFALSPKELPLSCFHLICLNWLNCYRAFCVCAQTPQNEHILISRLTAYHSCNPCRDSTDTTDPTMILKMSIREISIELLGKQHQKRLSVSRCRSIYGACLVISTSLKAYDSMPRRRKPGTTFLPRSIISQ